MKNKILVFAPLPPPLGGARQAFQQICNESNLFSEKFQTNFINIPLYRKNKFLNFFFRVLALIKLFLNIPFHNILIFHSSANLIFHLGPLIIMTAKFFKLRIQIRFFGSSLDLLMKKNPEKIKHFTGVDQILLETKGLIKHINNLQNNLNLIWFPNSRPIVSNQIISDKKIINKICYVGQISNMKGTNDLINSFENLTKQHKDIELHLVGQLMEKSILKRINKSEKIIYHGVKSNNECKKIISDSDIFIYPSKYISEGYSGAILEAMSLGKPIIASNWRFNGEIVIDNFNGKLYDINLPEDIITQINYYIKNPKMIQIHGKNSFINAKKFDSKYWNKIVYNNLLNKITNDIGKN